MPDTTLARIGVRATIDGRLGGVRESLESQTMAMAHAAAELISGNVRLASGEPAECVVFPQTIGGAAEAAAAERHFQQQGVGASLTVTPCWCYGSETIDMDPLRPKAIWGLNGTERPGAVYLAAALAAHSQKGLPAFGVYGRDVQDADAEGVPGDVADKLLRFARGALAVAQMRGRSYLSVGGVSMGIAGSIVDADLFERYLGMRVECVDMIEVERRIARGIFDSQEFEAAHAWVKAHCTEGFDANDEAARRDRSSLDHEWETSVKMALVVRDLMQGNPRLGELGYGEEALGHNAIAGGFQGQRQWTDHRPNGDFMEAMLNSSFDWRGVRQPSIIATENDALNAITMLFGHLLTGSAQVFADLRTYWSPEAVERVTGWRLEGAAEGGLLHLINSGPAALDGAGEQTLDGEPTMKPWWQVTDSDAEACRNATTWHPSITEYFPGGGWSTRYRTRGGMKATIARLNLVEGLGPALQLAEGVTVDLPTEVHDALDRRTNPTWPTTWFAPRTTDSGVFSDTYEVMNHWGANHCVMTPGHVGADLVTLASMLRIPVYMHNLSDVAPFRPTAWNAFGTEGRESADFRACAAYGPLYG
ncbi:MAG: L-fucose isomerase [Planctomycetota bacterium]